MYRETYQSYGKHCNGFNTKPIVAYFEKDVEVRPKSLGDKAIATISVLKKKRLGNFKVYVVISELSVYFLYRLTQVFELFVPTMHIP